MDESVEGHDSGGGSEVGRKMGEVDSKLRFEEGGEHFVCSHRFD